MKIISGMRLEPREMGSPDQNPAMPQGEELRRSMRLATVAWLFGSVWITATSGAPLTLFAQALGASNFQFGLLAAMPFVTSLLSLPAGLFTDRTGQRKAIFLIGLFAQRFMWFAIALLPVWILTRHGSAARAVALWAFLALMFLMHSGQAVGGPAWTSWMADLVPARVRGHYFARRRLWGLLTAVPAAVITGLILDVLQRRGALGSGNEIATLRSCGGLFVVSALFGIVDIACFGYIRDVAPPPHTSSLAGIFIKPMRDPQFLWFAGYVGTLTFAVSFMGQFLSLFLIEKLHVNNLQTQLILLVAPAFAQMFVFTAWGKAVDRMGKKPVMAIASLGLVPVGVGWCFINGGHMIWLGYVLSGVGAALWAGVEIANFQIVLEMAGTNEETGEGGGTSYVAVNSVIINIAGCLGGFCSGAIAQGLRNWSFDLGAPGLPRIGFYEILFALSGVMRLLAVVVFLPRLHEPEARRTHEALRFMTANIYNNLFNAIFQPLRMALAWKEQKSDQERETL